MYTAPVADRRYVLVMPTADPLIEVWLGSLAPRTVNTVKTYRTGITAFYVWLSEQDKRLVDVFGDDLNRYGLHVSQQKYTASTEQARFGAVRNFYKWMHDGGRIDHNPAHKFRTGTAPKMVLTNVLSLSDLRSLVLAVTGDRDRTILYLMLLCGLNAEAISRLDLSDLMQTANGFQIRLPGGRSTPLPDILAEPLVRATAGRRRGPLVLNERGHRLTHMNVRRLTAKWAKAANLGVDVVPQMLLASIRDLLVHEPVPLVAILQALGSGAKTNLAERCKIAPTATQHVSFRLALLLRPDATSAAAYFDHADALSSQHGVPTAARVILAASTFERHLRELAIARTVVPPSIRKTTLGFLSGALRDAGVLSEAEFKVCGVIATTRDWAAHGWYEKVNEASADQAVRDMRRLVAEHPG